MKKIFLVLFLAAVLADAMPTGPAELTLRDLSGKRVRLRDSRGQIVVVNFWATWCSSCAEEMPMLMDAERQYGARGVVFVGVSLDDRKTRRNIPEFVNNYRINFPVWIGATSDDAARMGLGNIVPSTVFVDRDGRIIARVEGTLRPEELKERIEWLLGDRTAPPPALIRHVGLN